MSHYEEYLHVVREHAGQLPEGFLPCPGVTWHQVHHLLHRLRKWKDWE